MAVRMFTGNLMLATASFILGPMGPRSSRVVSEAATLARTEPDSAAAVKAVLRVARGNRRLVKRAHNAAFRLLQDVDGRSEVWSRAEQILDAALTGSSLPDLSSDQQRRMSEEWEIQSLPLEEAFEVLCARAPALRELTKQIEREGLDVTDETVRRAVKKMLKVPYLPERRHVPIDMLTDENRVALALREKLETVVGPHANSSDWVVISPSAHSVAVRYLLWKVTGHRDSGM